MRGFPLPSLSLVPLLLAGAASAAPAQAGRGGPDTPAARRLAELVRAVNTGSADSLRRYVSAGFSSASQARLPAEERVERLLDIYGSSGGLAVKEVESPSTTEASALVQGKRTESWGRLTVLVDGAAPHAIDRVGFGPASDPTVPARRLTDAEVVAQLKAHVERLAKSDDFSGTVLLAKHGKPLYSAAFGEANKDFGARNRLDTKFNLGSMNKMFTAVAVAQLAEAGKLSFDDSLGKFLPAGTMRPEVLAKVRIKHLLTHTSGLGSYFTPEWDAMSRARFRTVDDWMPLVKAESLQFEPGTRWSYSNTGMLVLGKVIEVATGQDYFHYVREHVYERAGMTNSDAYELDRVNPNLAVGYERRYTAAGVDVRNNIFVHVIRGGPAGGGYSTVEDLTRFAVALQSGRLVRPASVRLLTSPKPEVASPEYGYGFGVEEGGKIVGHSGGFVGINSQLDIYPAEGYTLAVMSNYGGGAAPVVAKARALLLAGRRATVSSR